MVGSVLHVAAAAVFDGDGKVLIARRAEHRHQGGLWEFPGGKVEPGEQVRDALARELAEELGIVPQRARPLIRVPHHYPDRSVVLDVWRVDAFRGVARGLEGQPLRWVSPAELGDYAFPAANLPIVRAAQLPETYLITPQLRDIQPFLAQLETALAAGIRMVQLRAPELSPEAYRQLAAQVLPRVRAQGARLLLNADPELVETLGADGVHLNGQRLQALSRRPLPSGLLVGASCHDAEQLNHAQELGADFALLSPVNPTASHPEAAALGWRGFEALVREVPMPVYALGGVGPSDLDRAWQAGGQGVAGIRALWPAVPSP